MFSAHGRSVPGAGAPVADLRHVRRRPGAHSERSHQLIGYGNWSRAGSKHVTDQLELASQKRMRPILRARREIEAALEYRQDLQDLQTD